MLRKSLVTIFAVLFIDQASKVWVKLNMHINESIPVFDDWFYIHFIENPGMAFGMEFWGENGKLLLSVFRLFAAAGFIWYLLKLIKEGAHKGLILSVALVLAGALGNIIDSVFYGVIFSESPYFSIETARFLPPEGGYSSWLHGYVVDMLYFPIVDTYWPEWVPYFGGEQLQFFRPVFNVADTAISVGLGIIVVRQKAFFKEQQVEPVLENDTPEEEKK